MTNRYLDAGSILRRRKACTVGARRILMLSSLAIFSSIIGQAQEPVSEEDSRVSLLTLYIVNQREKPAVPLAYGPQLINDLFRLLDADRKVPDLEKFLDLKDQKGAIFEGLIRAIKAFDGSEEAKVGKRKIYDLALNSDSQMQDFAMGGLATLDGQNATDLWLKKLRDPVEWTRILASGMLGAHGRLDAADQMERILRERAQGLSGPQIAMDHSFRFGEAAIEELRDRAAGKNGPHASERVNARDLIERGPKKAAQVEAPRAEAPETERARQLDPTPAKPELNGSRDVPVPALETPNSSEGLLWSVIAIVAALLGGFVFIWRRRS